jgi:DNA sulfur modification protein DndE
MRLLGKCLACSLFPFSLFLGVCQESGAHGKPAELPFEMPSIRVPEFPDRRVSIVDFGAVPDARTLNTRAFADAIRTCSHAGGGTVVVPSGFWLTGPIRLEDNINLHLERGALLQFSNKIDDYPIIQGFAGTSKRFIVTPPLSAYKAKNLAITGDGIIDGAGEVWRYVKREKLTAQQWKSLMASGGVVTADGKEWWPSRAAMEGEAYLRKIEASGATLTAADYAKAREFLRPDMVYLVQCTSVLLEGPTFENSPRFHVHPVQCEDLTIRNISVRAPWYAQNADGIDLSSCRKVLIENATVDVGDDGLCLKPGSLAESQSPGPACENILIRDCVVYRAHGGFVIGSESYGGVRNVAVRNCTFVGTDVGLRFKSARDRGGVVEKLYIDGVRMRDIATDAILFDMYYAGGAPDVEAAKDLTVRRAEPVTDRTPQFHDIVLRNVVCDGAARAMVINGLPEMPVRDIVLDSVSLSTAAGVFLADAENITMRGCSFFPVAGPVFSVIQSRLITVKGGSVPPGAEPVVRVAGDRSGDVTIEGMAKSRFKRPVELGKGVRPDAVRWE